MDISKIPNFVYQDLKRRDMSDEEIKSSNPELLFSEYCEWNGLIGWSGSLISALDGLRQADT